MLPVVSAELRAVEDSKLHFSQSGVALASFRAAANSRKLNKETDTWEDDKVCWLTVKCFKRLAENVAESVLKGQLVNVTGRLQTEDWETEAGEKRQTYVLVADTVSLSLAYAPAQSMASERPAATTTAAPAAEPVPVPAAQSEDPPF